MTPASSASQFLRTLSLVGLAFAGIFSLDTFLAKTEESESHIEATRLYTEGQQMLEQGRNTEAVGRFEDAIEIDRTNHDYQLALARAQAANGDLPAAKATLEALLSADSTDGAANLSMARVLVKLNRIPEAISYYHRAVYGAWPTGAAANRLQVRFELIDLLAAQNRKEELLGELLAVQDQTPNDVPTRLRIASMFLEAGSPSRAADLYEGLLKQHPADEQPADMAAAYAGLGEAKFAQADYRAAATDFSSAVRLNPADQSAAQRLELSDRIMMLDPSRRGLDAPERLRRSLALLSMTIDAVQPCAAPDALDDARKMLDQHVPGGRQDSAAESALDEAEQLWQARTAGCGPAKDDALALVLARTAQ